MSSNINCEYFAPAIPLYSTTFSNVIGGSEFQADLSSVSTSQSRTHETHEETRVNSSSSRSSFSVSPVVGQIFRALLWMAFCSSGAYKIKGTRLSAGAGAALGLVAYAAIQFAVRAKGDNSEIKRK